jgi:phenylpropionate dioxygenase-like ring-hydroxylating dioxygenase large terminal subunit
MTATWSNLVERLLSYRDGGGTDLAAEALVNPVSVYTDAAHYAHELDQIFRKGPLPVALSADLRRRGDFVTTEIAGVPVLTVRADDGALRAFINVCPHRGATLVERSGRITNTIRCPFHGWIFGLDGAPRATRSFETGFGDIAGELTSLQQVPVWESHGFIYVATTNQCLDTSPLESLSMLGADFAALRLDDYIFFRENVSLLSMNWKLPVDSFLETYHVPSLHRTSVAPFYLDRPVLFDSLGWNARMCQWRRTALDSLNEGATDEQFRKHGNLIFFLFPNAILNFPIPGCLEFWHMMPDGVDRVRVTTRFYTNRAVDSPRSFDFCNQNFELSNRVVYQEDFPLHSAVYSAMAAGALERMLYGRNEPGLIHFHTLLAERLDTAHA